MKLAITHVITFTLIVDTEESGYDKPDSLDACIQQEKATVYATPHSFMEALDSQPFEAIVRGVEIK